MNTFKGVTCDEQYKEGSQAKWYSPYISICQSSGLGKSRTVRQLSALIPVLYLSYQHAGIQGYPGRTKKAIDFLTVNFDVGQSEDDSNAQTCLTIESCDRLVFASKRYQDFWTKKRQQMLHMNL
jgi:hypothetical protein